MAGLQNAGFPSWKDLQYHLEEQLTLIRQEESRLLQIAERSIRVCTEALKSVQETILPRALDGQQEIYFYKEVKPFFLSQLIFYNRAYDMEVGKPPGGINDQEAYYQKELKRINEFYEDNRFIYRYIRSGATYLDEKLFFHPPAGSIFALYGFDSPAETPFPVCYDHVVARIKAGELLQDYLFSALEELHQPGQGGAGTLPRITWTDTKTALIELAYALQSAGVLNSGKIELKEIVDFFQLIFHINLGNYPRTFQEILSRKTGYTNFIDKLRDKLLLRIRNIEEKYEP
jgi:hypothetical protein